MRLRYFLITGSDEICEVVEQAELFQAVHDLFCCGNDVESCDNGYFEAFKEEWRDGAEFEGWHEGLEDGWLDVEELPAQPRQLAKLRADNKALLDALKAVKACAYSSDVPAIKAAWALAEAAIEHSEPQ